ncbi:methyl-accepting chemotaxis protein [Paenibacillus sp. J5C_2022]|uniref:methyl-accepting chemotaxis protein n=1 Tax=Paenibacillus sp. J5C2022 TaxID=2977129 RepID=UPI0021D1B858|nr:methyl-accepting chemotaxis protein [Paenibacillus sp. J5C2022]MCU6709646.1 methyl-accepting chemotaxis protein [Paenibacillus sp. J5C2022]
MLGRKNQDEQNGQADGKKSGTLEAGDKTRAPKNDWFALIKQAVISNPLKSVGKKLFLIILISIVACVYFVSAMSYLQAKRLIVDNVSQASFQTVQQVANNLDVRFRTYVDLTLQIVIDKVMSENLEVLAETKDAFQSLSANRELSEKLNNYIMSNDSIAGAALIPMKKDGGMILAGASRTVDKEVLFESEWFKKTVELDGRTNWIEPQESGIIVSGHRDSIAVARLIKNIQNSQNSYMLVIELPLGKIADNYSEVNLGEGSMLTIESISGHYVQHSDKALIGQPSAVALPSEGNEALEGSLELKTSDGDDVLAVYKQFSVAPDWRLVGTIPVGMLAEQAGVIQESMVDAVLIAAVLAIAIGIFVILTIARPLTQLRNLMVEGAGGNLTIQSQVKGRKDEIGQLADSFNEMMSQIKTLAVHTTQSAAEVIATASELTDASKKTSIAAKEISIATDEIAGGATSLAVEAEKGSDLTGNINTQMKEVMSANVQMTESAADVESASEQGTAHMNLLIERTGMTEEMTRSMVEKVEALKESTSSIVKILDVLNNLTKQTNILSLNATIEAARAGAAGKGFMVVADEIRQLADQSKQSIEVVGQITASIQSEIEETVNVLSKAYPMFQEQISSVKEASSIFLSVQGQMGQFKDKLGLVTVSIQELDHTQSVLSEAMTNVSAVAQQSSATSEEVASLSSEQLSISENLVSLSNKLDSVSKALQESLAKFKME